MALADFSMSDLILFVTVLLVFRLRGAELVAAGAFVLCSILHTVATLVVPVSDIVYYASAVVADFVALIVLCGVRPVCGVVYGLARVCVASMALNLVGLLCWWLYLPAWPYNLAFMVLYVVALGIIGSGGANGMGGRAVRWRFSRLAFPASASGAGCNKA
ncbi:hypothetical protein [Vibrio phage VP16C]|nr:hypothetical protein [Vibrio phage VP16C]